MELFLYILFNMWMLGWIYIIHAGEFHQETNAYQRFYIAFMLTLLWPLLLLPTKENDDDA